LLAGAPERNDVFSIPGGRFRADTFAPPARVLAMRSSKSC